MSAVACNLCGSLESEVLFEAYGYPILECQKCGLAFTGLAVEQRATEEYYRDQYYAVAADYADSLKRAATESNEDQAERVRMAARLARLTSGRVLDIGCASGALLAAFKRAGWQCCGIEPAAELAAYARAALGCEIYQSALESATLPPAIFDVITASHVLEHSSDPRHFLECCSRLLKPNGVLLVEVPDFGSRLARKQGAAWRPLYPDTHLYHFTAATLSRLLAETGFRIARFRRYGGLGALAPSSGATGSETASSGNGHVHQAAPSLLDRFKQRIFEVRRVVYRVPALKRAARYTYWHLLRMNDYLSIYAIKARSV